MDNISTDDIDLEAFEGVIIWPSLLVISRININTVSICMESMHCHLLSTPVHLLIHVEVLFVVWRLLRPERCNFLFPMSDCNCQC